MTISTQAQDLVDAFRAQGMTLSPTVAELWYGVERGNYHNLVGVTSPSGYPGPGATSVARQKNGQFLNVYPNDAAGAAGAANLVKTSSYYANLRAILSGGSATWQQQLSALIASPWNRSYYQSSLGPYLDSAPKPTPTPAPKPTPATPAPAEPTSYQQSAPTGPVPGSLTDFVTQGSPTAPLTQALVNAIVGDIPVDNPNRDQIKQHLQGLVGTPINQIGFNAQWFNSPTGGLKDLTYLFPPLGQEKDKVIKALGWPEALAQILAFFLDPVNWERIGLGLLGLIAALVGLRLYLQGRHERLEMELANGTR